MPINRHASELVRTGKIGKIKTVQVCNYLPGLVWTPQPAQPVPDGLDWDVWCNQTELRPYHPTLHRQWANFVDYDDGGESWGVSGWGTHGLDQVQCALGMDRSGPVELWTEDRETKDLPDFPLAKDVRFQHLLKRKPVVLKFPTGTRHAIGARVTVVTGSLRQVEDVNPVRGYLSQGDPRLDFGLGNAEYADSVEIRWPDGVVEKLEKVKANQFLKLTHAAKAAGARP